MEDTGTSVQEHADAAPPHLLGLPATASGRRELPLNVYQQKTGRFIAKIALMPEKGAGSNRARIQMGSFATVGEAAVARDLAVLWRRGKGREPTRGKEVFFFCRQDG